MARAEPRRPRRLTGLLALVNVALLGAVWLAVTRPADIKPAASAQTPPPATTFTPSPPPRPKTEVASLTETLTRPLFSADRRPQPKTLPLAAVAPPPPVTLPTAPTATPPPTRVEPVIAVPASRPTFPADVHLIGIVASSAKDRRAIFRTDNTRQPTTAKVGQSISTWRVVEIADNAVTVETAGTRVVLKLFAQGRAEATKTR